MLGKSDDHLFLSALIALGLILFGFFVLANTGLLQLALSSDFMRFFCAGEYGLTAACSE